MKKPIRIVTSDEAVSHAVLQACMQLHVPGRIAEVIAVETAAIVAGKRSTEAEITGVLPTEENPWGFVEAEPEAFAERAFCSRCGRER